MANEQLGTGEELRGKIRSESDNQTENNNPNLSVEQPAVSPMKPLEDIKKPTILPRLAIQRLQLKNFKSYGGVVEVGPFHKSFSSIVGPNGSGKSNVIDAMLFVFGRRAKQLRHSKLSELLHHSATYPNVTSAKVTVFFHEIVDTGDEDDQYDILEDSSFTVAREAFRNNTSKYYLDEREIKMSEVVQLLKSKGVDLDNNRFLILQGEVEQIAMMKPKAPTTHEDGLLEYLEDIIGSNKYIEKIDSTSGTVEALNEERTHKMNRVKVAERERDALDGAKTEAENFLDKERVLLRKKIVLSKAINCDVMQSLKENSDRLSGAKAKIDEFRLTVAEKEEKMKVLEVKFNDTQEKCELAVRTMNDAKDRFTAFERKDIKLREDLKALKSKEKKLRGQAQKELVRFEEHKAKITESLDEKKAAEKKLTTIESSLETEQQKIEKILNAVKAKTAPIRRKLEENQAALLPFSEVVNKCRKELHISKNELKLVIEKLEAPKKKLEDARRSLKVLEEEYSESKKSLAEIDDNIGITTEAIKDNNKLVKQLQNRSKELVHTSTQMREKLEEARAIRDFSSTRTRLHKAILSASKNGQLQGIVGRLGDLATVDPQFSVAVGAAAGANLDNIVVQTAENAQACIHFLRRENLGRATFVILDKIGYLEAPMKNWSTSNRKADGPRLFDYLRIPNPENRTALYYGLRDTLVSNSLEEARRMAFKPSRLNRVVTMAGELIESSGAMTGGGKGPSRYRLGSGRDSREELNPAEIQHLSEKLDATIGERKKVDNEITRLESEKQIASTKLEEFELKATRVKLEVNSYEERLASMNRDTIPDLVQLVEASSRRRRSELNSDVQKRAELESKVDEREGALKGAKDSCNGIEAKILSLQEQIMAAGGREMKNAKLSVEKYRKQISDLQSVVSKAGSRAAADENAAGTASSAAKSAEKEVGNIKEHIEKSVQERDSMTDEAELVMQMFKETEGVHDQWIEKVKSAQGQYIAVKTDLKEIRREEVSLTETAAEFQRLVNRNEYSLETERKKLMGMQKKLASLSLMAVDAPDSADLTENENDEPVGENQEDVDSENSFQESGKSTPEKDGSKETEMSSRERKQLIAEISVLDSEIMNMDPNLGAIAEYKTKEQEYRTQVKELDTLTSRRDEAKRECDVLRRARLDEFMKGFSVITLKLKELYQMITLGGDAELELVDSLDPFSEGIVFSVRPPKKSWKNISNLSGGEKTLSSLALVFALHHFKPTPLYFLDEIDAALDYKNVSIVANYVKERTKNAQFIIISLRNNMFELADRLVGIYKTHNTTKSVTINPSAFIVPKEQGTSANS